MQVGSNRLAVVNVHNTDESGQRLSASLQETLRGQWVWLDLRSAVVPQSNPVRLLTGQKELVVLGDFGVPPQSAELDFLRKDKFCPLVPPGQFTDISTRSPQGSRSLDNIWVSRSVRKIFSGQSDPNPFEGSGTC